MRSSYITVIFVVSLASVDGDEEVEILPSPEPLASPERSAIDEQKFNMAATYLKNQFAIPHHLVPSFDDVAGISKSDQFEENAALGIQFSQNPDNHKSEDYPRLLNKERNSLTSDNFYDYYDYVEYPEYEPESSSSFYNYKRSKVIPESFFPEIKLHNQERGKQENKHYADYPTKSLPKDKESVRRIDEMPSSFSKGNWMRPPHVDHNRIKKGGNSNVRKYPSSPSRPVRHQGHNQNPHRRRRPSVNKRPSQNSGNFLSSIVEQVRGTLSNVFYGNRRNSMFPRIQYGPLDFGPPIKQMNQKPPRQKIKKDHKFYDYNYDPYSRNEYYYDDDDLYYDDYYDYYDQRVQKPPPPPPRKPLRGNKKRVSHSSSQGQISLAVPPTSTLPLDIDSSRRISTDESKINNDPSSEPIKLSDVKKNIKNDAAGNLNNHKLGSDHEDVKDKKEKAEVSTRPNISDKVNSDDIREQKLKELIDFVNGDKKPEKTNERKKTVHLGIKKQNSVDYDEIFDDVIETTPATLNIGWGQKMWKEIKDDFNRNPNKKRQKIKIKKAKPKKPTPVPISERPIKKNVKSSTRRNSNDDAKYLSIWAAAQKIAENGPSLKFDSEENYETDIRRQYSQSKIDLPIQEKPLMKQENNYYEPSVVTKDLYSDNFKGFHSKQANVRDFYSGFKPSSLDFSNDLSPSSSNKRQYEFHNPNLFNHATPLQESSYDQKMIIDMPPAKPSSLPPSSPMSAATHLTSGMTLQQPYINTPALETDTKTLQELTYGR